MVVISLTVMELEVSKEDPAGSPAALVRRAGCLPHTSQALNTNRTVCDIQLIPQSPYKLVLRSMREKKVDIDERVITFSKFHNI